jgi:hypothetical protein
MIRLHRDVQLRHRLARQARREYEPICWEVMRKRYLALIERLISSPRKEPAVAKCEEEGVNITTKALTTRDSAVRSKELQIPSRPDA